VTAGRLVGVFGVRGELKLDASRIGADALRAGLAVRLRFADGTTRPAVVAALRRHRGRLLIALRDVGDADAAAMLVPSELLLARGDVALASGEYFDADLVGCRVVDAAGIDRGEVVEVAHFPAQDLLLVGTRRAMLPLVGAFIRDVDVAAKRIEVDVPPGLLDGEPEEA
jgi:16S rRNA processing protein RimM